MYSRIQQIFCIKLLVIWCLVFWPGFCQAEKTFLAIQVETEEGWDIGLAQEGHSEVRMLTSNQISLTPYFSPDRRTLFFAGPHRINNFQYFQIYKIDLVTKKVTPISDGSGNDTFPVCSPDGKQVAFMSHPISLNNKEETNWRIYLMDTDGRNRQILDPQGPVQQGYPSWSPDGTKIVYVHTSLEDKFLIFPKSVLRVYDFNRRSSQELTSKTSFVTHPSYSPDGRLLAFTRTIPILGWQSIYTMRPDGSQWRKITTQRADDQAFWSPDSQYLYFSRAQEGRRVIYSVDVETREEQKVLDVSDISLEFPRVQILDLQALPDKGN